MIARNKMLVTVVPLFISILTSASINAATLNPYQYNAASVFESEGVLSDSMMAASSFMEDLAVDRFIDYTTKPVELLLNPYGSLFNTSESKVSDSRNSMMMLASLGLMGLIVRRRSSL